MITYTTKIHKTDEINLNILTGEELLQKLNFPYQQYIQGNETDKDFIIDLIIQDLIELEDTYSNIKYCTIITQPLNISKPIEIVEHIVKDANYTDKGIEDLSFSLGYELVC